MVEARGHKCQKLQLFNNAIQRLTRKQQYFGQFEGLEDWYFREAESAIDREVKYLSHIKEFVLNYYWEKDIYISPSALDYIIFHVIKTATPSTAADMVFEQVEKSGLHRRSVVIFPLHSFSFRDIGPSLLFKGVPDVHLEHGNFRVIAQTNSFAKSKEAVLRYLEDIHLPNRKSLDADLFDHFFRSRQLVWFERNPIMFINFRFSQWERFDNLRYILDKVSFLSIKLYFLASLVKHSDDARPFFSTGMVNNFETLDIHHFLTVTTSTQHSTVNCLPIHARRSMVFDFTNINVTLDLKGAVQRERIIHAFNTVERLHRGFAAYQIANKKRDTKFFRFAASLKQFRRSFQSVSDVDRVIFLQTAFESLLIDTMTSKKRDTMIKRTWLAMRGSGYRRHQIESSLGSLVDDRNDIIHAGEPPTRTTDFGPLYELYCRLVLRLANDIRRIDSTQSEYMSKYFASIAGSGG